MDAFDTAEEAAYHFAGAFQETAACVCDAPFKYPAAKALDEEQSLVLSGGADVRVSDDLYLFAGHYFTVTAAEPYGFAVRTGGYRYAINSDQARGELFSWHWDTRGVSWCSWPHLHARVWLADHLPTGRVAFEQVVRWLILEAKISPLRPDWENVLERNEQDWRDRRTWA